MDLVDIGANLTHDSFAGDLEDVVARAVDTGVGRFVVTGADVAGSRDALALASRYPERMRSTAGIHPHVARLAGPDAIASLRAVATEAPVTAIGEAGLDFNRDLSPRPVQERVFEQQLELAAELGLPVFAHQRDAHERFIELLRPWRERLTGVVVHCFTGTAEELDACIDLDCHIGITGWICDERRGQHLAAIVGRIPAGRLMLETDAPYLLPRDLSPKPKSRRNEPAHLPHIAERVAAARGETLEALAAHTTDTAFRFFGFDVQPRMNANAREVR